MRKLVAFTVPFALAAVLCCYFLSDAAALWLGISCAFGVLPFLFQQGRVRILGVLLTLGAAMGFLWFWGWTKVFVAPAYDMVGRTITVEAVALDYPIQTDRGVSVDARLEIGAIDVTARLYAGPECVKIEPGDILTFTGDFRRADLLGGEENTYFSTRGVFLLAYVGEGAMSWERPEQVPIYLLPRIWARALGKGIDTAFQAETAAFLRAVTLGDKSGLSDSVNTAFSRTGLSHFLVVSGLHVSMLLWGLTGLLRRHRRWIAPVSIPLLILFVLLVGCTPSAVRAAVMSGLILVAPLTGRENDPPTSLCTALLLLLIQNPYAAAGVGLQLSFASVAGILIVSRPLDHWLKIYACFNAPGRRGRMVNCLLNWLWSDLSVTLGAMLFTTPLIAMWFGSTSLISPLVNLLVLWTGKYIFLGGLLSGLIAMFLPTVAFIPALPVELLCRYVLWLVRGMGSLAFAAISLNGVYYRLWLVGTYTILALMFLFRREKKRIILPLCCPVLLLCAAIFFTSRTFTAAPLTVTALDVGQGSSTAFYSGGRAALVDCGGNGGISAGDVAADYFQSLGVSRLDLLVFTHLDGDHFNGTEELFARMEIGLVMLPEREDDYGRQAQLEEWAQAEGAAVVYVTETMEASLGSCGLILYPPLGSGTTNEEGIFVLCSAGDFDVLITGDADSSVEAMLVKYFSIPDVELLMVGHHGSNNSTSMEFLEAINPEYAIISSGYNSYGHPDPRVLERLNRADVEIYRTDQHGHVTVAASINGDESIG